MPADVVINFTTKLGWLQNIEFSISPRIDWVRLGEIGLMERMTPFLTNNFFVDGFAFTCNGWRNLFAISELLFQEICVEFFASVSFEEATVDPSCSRALFFRLSGDFKECSLAEFAW